MSGDLLHRFHFPTLYSSGQPPFSAVRPGFFLSDFQPAFEFVLLPLDIFRKILHNNGIRNKLDAWLTFLSVDEPETIVKLITEYPQFKKYYEEIYQLCLNTEKVMNMFSKELQELDRNTVQYMIDEMQDVIDSQKETINTMQKDHEQILAEKDRILAEKDRELAELRAKLTVSKESF